MVSRDFRVGERVKLHFEYLSYSVGTDPVSQPQVLSECLGKQVKLTCKLKQVRQMSKSIYLSICLSV